MLLHVLLLSAVVIWGWTFVATKILLAELGPIEIVAMRLATVHLLLQVVGLVTTTATNSGWMISVTPLALAVPLLGEPFGAVTAIGGGLVLAGVYVGQRDRLK